ncbi:hypothetical protein [Nonomuraea dietziae]|uniref:hypothetical protein n=1 Tax=Nonomuraea dietziae TaxID=65515 RepID=UPI0031E03248
MRALVLENERLRVTVLADKGGDVVEFLHKPSDTDLVWLSPQGLRRPLPPQAADDVGAFVDHYEGGWQEVFPNGRAPPVSTGAPGWPSTVEVAGLPCVGRGADRHGPARSRYGWRCARGACRTGWRRRSGSPRERPLWRSRGGSRTRRRWRCTRCGGHHLAFGRPFLRPGARIRCARGVVRVIPHATSIDPRGRRAEELFTVHAVQARRARSST